MTTVLLAHSHPAVRALVQDALAQAEDVAFVAEVSNGEEAWHLIQQVHWGVALVACSLSGSPGAVEIAEQIQAEGFDVHLVALGAPDHVSLLCRLWRAGALGCIPEEAAPEIIVEAVRAAARGRSLWTPEQIEQAQHWWDDVGPKLEALTGRERQVLDLMAEGLSNRQIAECLLLTENTVETHVRHVLSKLAARNRVGAAMVLAQRLNINQATPENH